LVATVDAYKRTHAIVAVDGKEDRRAHDWRHRHQGSSRPVAVGSAARRRTGLGGRGLPAPVSAIDPRLAAAGESIARVPPKLMREAELGPHVRRIGPIDALAVARAALREPDLPVARLDAPDRGVRVLVDHGEFLVAERTRVIFRLRWHLHKLDPSWEPHARAPDRPSAYDAIERHIAARDSVVPDSYHQSGIGWIVVA
jgi:hypothetical protein